MDRTPRAEGGPYIGRAMPRFEDLRLVRGAGKYSDDISMPGQAIAVFVRSPHAHAKIKRIDSGAARKIPGVVAVLTGADYAADGLKGAIQRANPAGAIDIKVRAFAPEKRPVLEEQQYPLITDRARYPGEAVAMVVAENVFAARNAAEAVEIEYDVLPAVTDVRNATGAEPIWPSPARTMSRSTRTSAMLRRYARCSKRPIWSSSRPSSISASSTARWSRARASRPMMRRRIPTRSFRATRACTRRAWCWRKASVCRWKRSASSAPTSAAASGFATISIPSRPRSCGRPSASAVR